MNDFLKATTKGNTTTWNGAISNSSTGSIFVDDFGKSGTYRGRDYLSVATEMSAMWGTDPVTTMKLMFYLRAITRKVSIKGTRTELVQKGQGVKDEFLKRMLWVAYEHPKAFMTNLWLIPIVGSYRDIWQLLYLDTKTNNLLNRDTIYKELVHDLAEDTTKDLFLKYMPIPKSSSKVTTDRGKAMNLFAKEFRNFCGLNNKAFRLMKSGGVAHSWQQYISNKRYMDINWSHIPGKALFDLVKGKFLTNHKLVEKDYLKWILEQPVVKFTGYPHELSQPVWDKPTSLSLIQKHTYDKQFEGLLEKAREDFGGIKGNVWCALDTSASMNRGMGPVAPIHACMSLGVYFSSLNEGAFKDHVIMFDDSSKVKKLSGTFTEKIINLKQSSTAWGSTNFQSVIDEIVRIRLRDPNIPISDFPETLLVVSDMQFNPIGYNTESNYESAMVKLSQVGLPKIKIIWWQVSTTTTDYPSTIDDEGTTVISGYDGAIMSLILGGEQIIDEQTNDVRSLTMQESLDLAINQEIFNLIKI